MKTDKPAGRRKVDIDDFRVSNPPLFDTTDTFENQVLFLQEKGWNAESITNQLHRTTTLTYASSRFDNPRKSSSWFKLLDRVCKAMGVDEAIE